MNQVTRVVGSLPSIIRNDEGLYQGNLIRYFQIIFSRAKNSQNPYHNFRHTTHVLWLCYQACIFYRDQLRPRPMRNLLIAAMFHDMDHSGKTGDDRLNIARAIAGLREHIISEDFMYFGDIMKIILATEFPYKIPSEQLELSFQIIRDADLAQALNPAWIQQVVFGLAEEWGKDPKEILAAQEPFLKNLKFCTEWGQAMFPQSDVDAKIAEARELLDFLG